jgi:branched-chain amino acid aminotransferase
MLSIEWNADRGWKAPQIRPYQPLLLDPSASVFQYAIECYEGMKAYRDDSGGIRLFRPDRNMARFNKSAARVALPNFNPDALLSLISTFVRLEERFVPKKRGYSLYLRPTMISTNAGLGIAPPSSALLYVIATPVGPYYPTGLKAITLQATNSSVRAWPGGAGHAKIGGNYAPCIVPQAVAALSGHQQILWLFGEDGAITEVGMMNMFAAMITRDGKKELVTAPLDGTILDGVTRNSVLSLARENLVPQGWSVVERKYTMRELAEASAEGNLLEAFGTGTAATICPIRAVSWDGTIVSCGLTESAESGEIASLMKEWIESRQYGDEKHQWSYVVR